MKGLVVALFALTILCPGQASADGGPWSVQFSGGAALPTQEMGDSELGTGLGFEGLVGYRFMPHLGAYAGWDWHHFIADESFAGPDVDVEETGYAFGLQFIHPIGESSLSYVIRAGGTFDHIEIENDEGDIVADSEHGLGWEAGLGLDMAFAGDWHVRPMVRYRTLSRDIDIEEEVTEVDLNYVALEVGFALSF
jgi:hypothetical protein